MAGLLARAAVAWVPLQPHPNYARAVPTKLVEAMASARPVVAGDFGRMAMIVRAADCGLLVEPGDGARVHEEQGHLEVAADALLGEGIGDEGRVAGGVDRDLGLLVGHEHRRGPGARHRPQPPDPRVGWLGPGTVGTSATRWHGPRRATRSLAHEGVDVARS